MDLTEKNHLGCKYRAGMKQISGSAADIRKEFEAARTAVNRQFPYQQLNSATCECGMHVDTRLIRSIIGGANLSGYSFIERLSWDSSR